MLEKNKYGTTNWEQSKSIHMKIQLLDSNPLLIRQSKLTNPTTKKKGGKTKEVIFIIHIPVHSIPKIRTTKIAGTFSAPQSNHNPHHQYSSWGWGQ